MDISQDSVRIFLAKPTKEIIGEIQHFVNPDHEFEWGNVHSFTFNIPYKVERDGDLVKYDKFSQTKNKFLLKVESLNMSEWYIIDKVRRVGNETNKEKQVTAYLLPNEMKGVKLDGWAGVYIDGEYQKEGLLLSQVATDILSETTWTVGEIDTDLSDTYRGFDFNDSDNVLSALSELAKSYNAIIDYDTENQTVSFISVDNASTDLGWLVSHGHLMRSLSDEVDSSEIFTRMIPIGKDGLQINSRNPSGSSYLMNYSYYMHPFKRDDEGNVIQSSDWMSDGLCHALLDYNDLTISRQVEFDNLVTQQENLYDDISNKLAEINDVELELIQVQDTIDVKQTNQQDATTELQEEEDLQTELDGLNSELEQLRSDLNDVQSSMQDISNELSMENNFTTEQLEELARFENTTTWEDSTITDVDELIEAGKEEFANASVPEDKTELELADLIKIAKYDNDVDDDILDKIRLGSRFTVHYEPFNLKLKTQIIKMSINYQSGSIRLETANSTNLKSNAEKITETIYASSKSSNDYSRNKSKYENVTEVQDQVQDWLQNGWDATKQMIKSGVNQSVTYDNRGITITDSEQPDRFMRITNGALGLTTDGGKTFRLAINPGGVFAERLVGKFLVGENLYIEDEEGTFNITGNLLTVKDRDEITRLLLGEYTDNKFGLQLFNKSGQDVVIDENGILQTWQEGRADNVDSSHGLTLHVYLPDDTISIRKTLLNFKILPFRSYSGTTESGGSTSVTSSNGGSTTITSSGGGGTSTTSGSGGSTTATSSSGGGTSTSTNSGGGTTRSSSVPGYSQGGDLYTQSPTSTNPSSHVHRIAKFTLDHTHTVSVPSHSHNFSTPNHTHSVSIGSHKHTITLSNHSHKVSIPNHTHTVNIPSHSHGIAHGIYTGSTARSVGVWINGLNVTNALGGSFNTDQQKLDIKSYMETGQWNEITLTSSRLGRIDANIFIQAFMGTD